MQYMFSGKKKSNIFEITHNIKLVLSGFSIFYMHSFAGIKSVVQCSNIVKYIKLHFIHLILNRCTASILHIVYY